jgi:hypothetical protein
MKTKLMGIRAKGDEDDDLYVPFAFNVLPMNVSSASHVQYYFPAPLLSGP